MHEIAENKRAGRAGNRLTPWLPAVAWGLVVYTLSAQSTLPSTLEYGITDKMAHFMVFAVLGLALAYGRYRSPWRAPHGLVLAAGLVYGIADEVHQSFVPNRHPSAADFVADAAGVLVGYGLVVLAMAAFAALRRRAPP